MNILRINLIANFVGRGLTSVITIACVPLYISYIGIESYGLVGIFITLQFLAASFDLGLSTTLNRELARASEQGGAAQATRDLVRTLELVYWSIAVTLGLSVVGLAPLLVVEWVRPQNLSLEMVQQALMLMGVGIVFQLPLSFYSGGLLGLQRHVLLNLITTACVTLRALGVLPVLIWIAPTITAFLLWNVSVIALQTFLIAIVLWRSLPGAEGPARFRLAVLGQVWRFAISLSVATLLGVLLLQIDKIVLSRALTLELFGYYSLASTVAFALYQLITPIFNAFFPRLSGLIAAGDEGALRVTYHFGAQIMALTIWPTALVLALFAPEVLFVWSGDQQIVAQASGLISILVLGNALSGMAHMPYALQLSYGWTSFALYQNLIALIFLIPALLIAVPLYGAVGAAVAWLIVNGCFVLISSPIMYRSLLAGEQGRWLIEDVGLPLLGGLAIALPLRLLLPLPTERLAGLIWLALVGCAIGLGCAITTPVGRVLLRKVSALIRNTRKTPAPLG